MIGEVTRGSDVGGLLRYLYGPDFWDRDAEDLLTGLLLAAALNNSTLSQVRTWLTAVSSVQPRTSSPHTGSPNSPTPWPDAPKAPSKPAKASTPPPEPQPPASPTPPS